MERDEADEKGVTHRLDRIIRRLPSRGLTDERAGAKEMEETYVPNAEEDAVDAEEVALEEEKGVGHDALHSERKESRIESKIEGSVVWRNNHREGKMRRGEAGSTHDANR